MTSAATLMNAFVPHDPMAMLYLAQSATYGLAFWVSRRGLHAPQQIYLASCLCHLTLALMHH